MLWSRLALLCIVLVGALAGTPALAQTSQKKQFDAKSLRAEILKRCKLDTQAEVDARLRKVGLIEPVEVELQVREHCRCVRLRRAARGSNLALKRAKWNLERFDDGMENGDVRSDLVDAIEAAEALYKKTLARLKTCPKDKTKSLKELVKEIFEEFDEVVRFPAVRELSGVKPTGCGDPSSHFRFECRNGYVVEVTYEIYAGCQPAIIIEAELVLTDRTCEPETVHPFPLELFPGAKRAYPAAAEPAVGDGGDTIGLGEARSMFVPESTMWMCTGEAVSVHPFAEFALFGGEEVVIEDSLFGFAEASYDGVAYFPEYYFVGTDELSLSLVDPSGATYESRVVLQYIDCSLSIATAEELEELSEPLEPIIQKLQATQAGVVDYEFEAEAGDPYDVELVLASDEVEEEPEQKQKHSFVFSF